MNICQCSVSVVSIVSVIIVVHSLFLLFFHSGSAQTGPHFILLGVFPMCKECARKKCPNKNKPPAMCERFLRYEDTAKFAAYDRMMRENKGVVLPEK